MYAVSATRYVLPLSSSNQAYWVYGDTDSMYHCVCSGLLYAGGADSDKLMQDLIKSAQRPVAAGKVRRKKADAATKRAAPLNKSKGFASTR